jgi:hypothetical protein
METLKKIVKNEYFPAAAVLVAVVLFWVIAMFGGLSLLNNNQPPMATLTWLLFVYAAAVLTPLAGVLAAVNLVRRWQRNREYSRAVAEAGVPGEVALPEEQESPAPAPLQHEQARPAPQTRPATQTRPAPQSRPVPQSGMDHQAPNHQTARNHRPKNQPLKKPAQAKQRKKAA